MQTQNNLITEANRGRYLDLNGECAGHVFIPGETRVSFAREFTPSYASKEQPLMNLVPTQVRDAIRISLIGEFQIVRANVKAGRKYADRCIIPNDTGVSKQFCQRALEMIAKEFGITEEEDALKMVGEYFSLVHDGYWDASLDCHQPVSIGTVLIRAQQKRRNASKRIK
jgi:hypothetical protein